MKNLFVVLQMVGKFLKFILLFPASSAGVMSPQKKSPPTTMLLPASPAKAPETEPIDVAAHLQLLGESLSLIGHRLQETEVGTTGASAATLWQTLRDVICWLVYIQTLSSYFLLSVARQQWSREWRQ